MDEWDDVVYTDEELQELFDEGCARIAEAGKEAANALNPTSEAVKGLSESFARIVDDNVLSASELKID